MNAGNLMVDWRNSFFIFLTSDSRASQLKEASLKSDLMAWTRLLTGIVADNCTNMGWTPAAKGHRCKEMPVRKSEYLLIDCMAFLREKSGWRFPIAVFELENSQDPDYVSYALWKLLCVRAPLRVLYCYRPSPEEGSGLVRRLHDSVIKPMPVEERINVPGSLIICVGNRDYAGTFPYDFFRWWEFDKNTGNFTRF